ncbi:MAG: Sua5/YciO/YrdC/YwlC family protein, partial [Chitinophagaceae bacterium]|nr:Sua5/YciO/YrdC/YwlC family protein [Chitinophagaceae bacterium]
MSYSFEYDIEPCLQVLQSGGLILYPTDTVWAIGCDATNVDAVERIYSMKKREHKKAMIVLVAEEKDILTYVTQTDLRIFDYIKGVHQPTTVIYDQAIGLAHNLLADDGSIGIRICRDVFCRQLIKRFRKPIVGTSANISGYPAPTTFRDIDALILRGVDYVVNYRRDDTHPGRPSS